MQAENTTGEAKHWQVDELRQTVARILAAAGSTEAEAATVAANLVMANQMLRWESGAVRDGEKPGFKDQVATWPIPKDKVMTFTLADWSPRSGNSRRGRWSATRQRY